MKTVLRIALAPVMLTIRLTLGLVAFLTSITSSVLGLSVSLFALLAVIEFFIGYWQTGSHSWFSRFWQALSDCRQSLPFF